MVSFFTHAVDNQQDGTRIYMESVQRIFIQDESSGLIEIQLVPGKQFYLLYLFGRLVCCYCSDGDQAFPSSLEDLDACWKDGEAHLRSLEMPSQAVRLALQALEWGPAADAEEIAVGELAVRLEKLKTAKTTGLLRAVTPQMDGFFVLFDGQVISAETVFSTSSGIASGLPNLRQLLDAGKLCQVDFYRPRLESASYQAFRLRMAMGNWVAVISARYQMLVGSNLIQVLNYDVNTALRIKRVNMRLVSSVLVDHHLFLDRQASQAAYRLLLDTLVQHMAKVVGTELAPRVLQDALNRLSSADQQVLLAGELTLVNMEPS